jgi:Cu+-exporting ATPase
MAQDPVCGMTVDPARAAAQVEHAGTTYFFCSKGCAAKFGADPTKYLSGVREPMHTAEHGPPTATDAKTIDPVCGMTVDPARAAAQVEHAGTTYFFCSKGCAAKFTADPNKYLSGVREPMPARAPQLISLGGLKRTAQPEPAAPRSRDPRAPSRPSGSARWIPRS